MGNLGQNCTATTILDVLRVDLCARAILDYVPVRELVRSERVCKRWQAVVFDYMQGCRTLCFYDVKYPHECLDCNDTMMFPNNIVTDIDRNVVIPFDDCNPSLVRKSIEKWGPCIVKLTTERYDGEYFQIIASNCPKLKHIKIRVIGNRRCHIDDILGKSFQNIDCEKIEIVSRSINGSFLKYVESRDLKSLTLDRCFRLSISHLLCAKHVIRNITSLALDNNYRRVVQNIHWLLNEMPQLEELSLRNYRRHSESFSQESMAAFSRLANLKHLNMTNNGSVNDALLEAVAQGCKKLEYLDIRCWNQLGRIGEGRMSARGLSALCCRSPDAVTTLHFGYLTCAKDIIYKDQDIKDFFNHPVIQEIKMYCCLEPTLKWFEAAAILWLSQGGQVPVPLELPSGCNSLKFQDPGQKLKIMLFISDV